MNRSNLTGLRFASLMLSVSLGVAGCATSPLRYEDRFTGTTNGECTRLLKKTDWTDELNLLAATQDLFQAECWNEVRHLGRLLRERLRDKTYSVLGEIGSVFVSEAKSSSYVLESHERVYLTLLIAMSSFREGDRENAEIELRRANDEMNAVLYTYGEDRLNAALIAALWDDLDRPELAEPYWRRLGAEQIPRGRKKVFGVGKMAGYEWSLGGGGQGVYRIRPKEMLPEVCRSKTGLVVPATDWVAKMGLRHSKDYHPLLNAKSLVRLPVGVIYGGATVVGGVLVSVTGCGFIFVLGAALTGGQVSQGGGDFLVKACEPFFELGGEIIKQAPDAFQAAAQPDLRHWPRTPAALLITTAPAIDGEECVLESVGNRKTTPLL